MNLKITIFSLVMSTGLFAVLPAPAAAAPQMAQVDQDRKKPKLSRKTPKRINDDRMDNARKRSRNYQTDNISRQSKKRKYTRTLAPVETARFNPVSWAKPTKWVQKRLPKQDRDEQAAPLDDQIATAE